MLNKHQRQCDWDTRTYHTAEEKEGNKNCSAHQRRTSCEKTIFNNFHCLLVAPFANHSSSGNSYQCSYSKTAIASRTIQRAALSHGCAKSSSSSTCLPKTCISTLACHTYLLNEFVFRYVAAPIDQLHTSQQWRWRRQSRESPQ